MMFAQPFWPEGFFDVVCTDSFIPEFWLTPPPAYSHQHEKQTKRFRHASQSPASQGDPPAGSSQQAAAQDAETEARQEQKQNVQQEQNVQPQQQQSWQQQQVQQHDTQQQQQQQQQEAVHCMVGFVAGSKAEEISKLRQNSIVLKTLSQLDDMFRKSCMRHGNFSCDAATSAADTDMTGGIACVGCALIYVYVSMLYCALMYI